MAIVFDTIHLNILDGVEMKLLGLTRQPSIGKSIYNDVDYTFDLLGGLIFLLLLRPVFVSLLVMPLSPSVFCYVPPSINIMFFVLMFLCPLGLAHIGLLLMQSSLGRDKSLEP